MTSLWRNVSIIVVANSNWSYLLISATKVRWRVQPTAARWSGRFNKMHEALHALHMSLNNASMRTVRKCLKMKNGYLITPNLNRMEILYPESNARSYFETFIEAQNSFRIKNCTVEDVGHFPAGLINKAVPSFTCKVLFLMACKIHLSF